MQFHIKMTGPVPDFGVIEEAMREADPSALVDIDPENQTLRVAASIDAAQLLSLVNQAGYPVFKHQLVQLPSECCGGCGG